ncbi:MULTISPECIES: hypothetical protein [unclassified Enterococcus]|uniref:DUF7006 family protein n=1 Tax=unclassified Enterococcus TaxID=2608891 RepID=UPI001556E6A2|nr:MULTISPECIES: hypothetical protein [unclassified Enterococcus]MBS7577114.1 hypothetical protein [Enterococcus sp. MMGLQ5-2]MBS7584439.1 hypothetical protein [Enterococcus sp. MMGLQ5-1]NPD12294.1 hypothetical protein [Enterococcus sp. MMGLQ5-1]NPD36948.1 hypothetical protein [Enterococcus sp. MMGLQ5-2]
MFFQTEKEYITIMREDINFDLVQKKMPKLYDYWMIQESEVLKLCKNFNGDLMWLSLQKMILIDAKLVILRNHFQDCEKYYFDESALIQLIEHDCKGINKEMCGYRLNKKAHNSLIFGKQ